MSWGLKRIRTIAAMYVNSIGLTLRKNLALWAVTRRTSKNHKLPELGDGRLPRTIWYFCWMFMSCSLFPALQLLIGMAKVSIDVTLMDQAQIKKCMGGGGCMDIK